MPTNEELLDRYISQRELAFKLGKCVRTLKRWSALRYGPRPVRVGKSLYYHVDDVRTWLAGLRELPETSTARTNRLQPSAPGGWR